jgi:MinD-like ATPase involved in chromosome partitioning or flagellar assembly
MNGIKVNRIGIATLDGGAGKTALAFVLAKELDYYLISNDDSVIEMAYKGMAKIMKNPKIIDDVVYDFGGFADAGVIDIIKHCDIVIVPCINDLNSKMKAIKTIKELSKYNDNFLVVATRIETDADFNEIQKAIQDEFKNIPVLPLKKTKMLKNALEYGNSPLELITESKKIAWDGRGFIPQYKEILKAVLNDDDRYNNLLKEKSKGDL